MYPTQHSNKKGEETLLLNHPLRKNECHEMVGLG
jgi:hypothetical protein